MKPSSPDVIAALDAAWDPESGVLGKLRDGKYDPELAQNYLSILDSITIEEGEQLPSDFVRLLWFAPIFSEWQSKGMPEFVSESVKSEVANFANKVLDRVIQLLGTP